MLSSREKRYKCVTCEEEKIESLPLNEHTYQEVWTKDRTNHWKECTECATAKDTKEHTMKNGKCTVCGFGVTEGLAYRKIEGVEEYAVIGIGTAIDSEIVIPSTYNGLPVTVIETYAFDEEDTIISVNIPNSVKKICEGAFLMCANLKTINIPNSVINIGEIAFALCEKLNIYLEEGNSVYHMAGNCLIERETKTLLVGCYNSIIPTDGSVTNIGKNAFAGLITLTTITIPEGVTSIEEGAFSYCTELKDLYIPNSITSIGAYALDSLYITTIHYNGTKEQWTALVGNTVIAFESSELNIQCTDGKWERNTTL